MVIFSIIFQIDAFLLILRTTYLHVPYYKNYILIFSNLSKSISMTPFIYLMLSWTPASVISQYLVLNPINIEDKSIRSPH